MLRLTRIEEGACYVTDTTSLYVAWSMLCSSSKLFWGCEIIQNLDKVKSLLDRTKSGQDILEKSDAWSELIVLLQNIESPVLDAVRIVICFENYFKAKMLLDGYVIHQMDLAVCKQNYPQFMKNEKELLQKTAPILANDVKQAERQADWSTEPFQTLTKQTIGMRMLVEQPKYRAIYSSQEPDAQRLFSVLERLNETRNTLHFLSVEYVPEEIDKFLFLRDYVSTHIDALAIKIMHEDKWKIDVGKSEIHHLLDIEHGDLDEE
jgi:hypothetical protein